VPADNLAYLLKYDSTQGRFGYEVNSEKSSSSAAEDDVLSVNGHKIKCLAVKEGPTAMPWKDLKIDLVLESTGLFTDAEKAKGQKNEEAMTRLADSLRARAAAGEDIAKLQKEAFDAAGMKIESPTVNLPSVRRNGLPQPHVAVFYLKPGEVSQVINDAGGHYIYKMNSKSTMPLDQAKNEIRGKIQSDRMREKMEKLSASFSSVSNEAYFGPGGAGPMPPPRMPRPRPGTPGTAPAAQPPSGQPPAPQKD
jgi:hypothetical protein